MTLYVYLNFRYKQHAEEPSGVLRENGYILTVQYTCNLIFLITSLVFM